MGWGNETMIICPHCGFQCMRNEGICPYCKKPTNPIIKHTGIQIPIPFDLEEDEGLIMTHCLTHRVVFPIKLGGLSKVVSPFEYILFGSDEKRYNASLFLTNKRLVVFGGDWKKKMFYPMGLIAEIPLDKILSMHVKDKKLMGNHLIITYYDSGNVQSYVGLWLMSMEKFSFSNKPIDIVNNNTNLWINKIKEAQNIFKKTLEESTKKSKPIIKKKMSICPYCGEKLNFPESPKFCPYCQKQISVE